MDLLTPEPQFAPYQLRAMTMVARAGDSGLDQPQRALLDAVQRVVLETDLDIATLEPISPADLAARAVDPAQARQLIRLMVTLSLADGPPRKEQMSLLSAFAVALGVDEPSVRVIGHLSKGRRLRFRLAFLRRSHLRAYLRNTRRMSGGIRPLLKRMLIFRGAIQEDLQTASRYRALEDMPEHHSATSSSDTASTAACRSPARRVASRTVPSFTTSHTCSPATIRRPRVR